MSISVTTNVFRGGGRPHTVKIFEVGQNDPFPLPDGSQILYVEFLNERDSIEIWAAVPDSSIVSSETKEVPEERQIKVPSFLSKEVDLSELKPPTVATVGELEDDDEDFGEPPLFYMDVDDE